MVNTILKRQRQWVGHLLRRNSLLTEVLEGRCRGKKAKGRPRQKLLDNLLNGKTRKSKEGGARPGKQEGR